MNKTVHKYIFAGGGTGGHLYPAVAVAEQILMIEPNSKVLFVGTKNKIESKVIPKLGYKFKSIWISGFSRRFTLRNLLFPIKLFVSIIQSFLINLNFKPDVAIGAGAYVSGPIAWMAHLFGSKIVLLEQNSYPGVTNRMLEKKADRIHISFEDSRKYFKEKDKLKLSGNPIRTTLKLTDKSSALKEFNLSEEKKTLLVLGGSLGASSINTAVKNNLENLNKAGIQIIWQVGELYYDEYKNLENEFVKIFPFISNMSTAYSSCDLLLARAGATTIAEVSYLGLPVVFVPSTNVAANHQFKNAKSLFDVNAGLLIEDNELNSKLSEVVVNTINDVELLSTLRKNIKKFAKPEAAKNIALDVIKLAESSKVN